MANVIWKFRIDHEDRWVRMPKGAKPLSVQVQRNEPHLWALVDPFANPVQTRVQIYGTGHEIDLTDECSRYIGTFQLHDGLLVFHLFMEPQ